MKPCIPDTLGPERAVLMSSEIKDLLWQSIMIHLIPVTSVHNGRVSTIQECGLEWCLQFTGLDQSGVHNSGVWIRGVSAIQGSGLEGCPQFRAQD